MIQLLLVLALTTPTDQDLIQNLSDRSYQTRVTASLALQDRLMGESRTPETFRAVRDALEDPETPLEAIHRLTRIEFNYFHWAYDSQMEVFTQTINAVHRPLIGTIADRRVERLLLPPQFIWNLPREVRYIDDRDTADECYQEALQLLGSHHGIVLDPQRYNHDLAMRYATHLRMYYWMCDGNDPLEFIPYLEVMSIAETEERLLIYEASEAFYISGYIHTRETPGPIEDRLEALEQAILWKVHHQDLDLSQFAPSHTLLLKSNPPEPPVDP